MASVNVGPLLDWTGLDVGNAAQQLANESPTGQPQQPAGTVAGGTYAAPVSFLSQVMGNA